MSVPDSAAVGAALLAGVGSGVYSDVIAATEKTYNQAGHALPGQNVERYNMLYTQFETLYPALRENFDAIASITNDRDAERP
jgi:xylulokinase